jgi:chloramphenicol O-acetyltransferase type A
MLDQRKELFDFYQGFDSPILNITLDLEIQNIIPLLKEAKISFFQHFVYALCKSVLEIEHFNLRYDGKKIYKTKSLVPSYTVLRESGNFNFCTFEYTSDWSNFLERSMTAKSVAEQSEGLCHDDMEHKNYIFITCLPWFQFSSIQHPVGRFKDSTIPSFALGKFTITDSVMKMPLSVQVHHGLVDGVHIAQFVENLKTNLQLLPQN